MAAKKLLQINMGRGEAAANLCNIKIEQEQIDMILIQEPYYRYRPPRGYREYKNSPEAKAIIVARDSIKAQMLTNETTNNVVVIEIENWADNRLNVINIYDEPDEGRVDGRFKEQEDKLSIKNSPIILCGDFNAKNEVWGSNRSDPRGVYILEWLIRNDYYLHNEATDPPTFRTSRAMGWVDLLATKGVNITDRQIEDTETLSDHVYVSFKVEAQVRQTNITKKYKYDFSKAKWDNIIMDLKTYKVGQEDLETEAERLQDKCREVCQRNIPRKKGGKKSNTWWSSNLSRIRREVRKARKKYQEERDGEMRLMRREEYVIKRNKYKKEIKNTKEKSFEERLNTFQSDPWKFAYKIIRKEKKSTGKATMKKRDGTYTRTIEETLRYAFEKYFPSDDAESDIEKTTEIRVSVKNRPKTAIDTVKITTKEILNTANTYSKGKAMSYDEIPNEALRYIAEGAKEQLRDLYNRCLEESFFPKAWKKAEVVWIPKKSEELRPISLLPALGKILDKILANRMTHYYESNKLFNHRQYGFREGRDTIAAVNELVENIRTARKNKKHVLVILLDLKNAFNTAWIPGVILEISRQQVPTYLINIIEKFLENRTAISENLEMKVERGCPQGSSLGPVLWIALMECWFREIQTDEVKLQAFADDQVILIEAPSAKNIEKKWAEIWGKCQKWAKKYKLEYNEGKTEALFISASGKIRHPKITMGEKVINTEGPIEYLGININNKLSWQDHIGKIKGRTMDMATKMFYIARRDWGGRWENLKQIYERAVKPMVLYGAEIWGEEAQKGVVRRKLRSVERPFLLALTRGYETTSTPALQVIAGSVPLDIKAESQHYGYRLRQDIKRKYCVKPEDRLHPTIDGLLPTVNKTQDTATYYTDATYMDGGWSTCGILAIKREHRSKWSYDLGKMGSNNQAEREGVLKALELVAQTTDRNAIVYTDSETTVQALRKPKTRDKTILTIQKTIIDLLTRQTDVEVMWASRQTSGIKEAEEVAKREIKEERMVEQVDTELLTKRQLTTRLKTRELTNWQSTWNTETRGRWTHRLKPTVDTDGIKTDYYLTQLLTGHGQMNTYFRRFKLRPTDGKCDNCDLDEEEDIEHILTKCTDIIRQDARRRALEVLGRENSPPLLSNISSEGLDALRLWARQIFEGKEIF